MRVPGISLALIRATALDRPLSRAWREGFARRDLGGSFAPAHAVVGIFIVNNRPETMAGRFYNRRFASRSSHDGCAGAWPRPRYASAQQKARRGVPSGRLA